MRNNYLPIILICFLFISGFSLSQSDSTKKKNEPVKIERCRAITQAGTQCKRNAKEGSIYCWQHQEFDKEKEKISKSKDSRTIHTGPRGGQYYYNSKGKKTYIKKKK